MMCRVCNYLIKIWQYELFHFLLILIFNIVIVMIGDDKVEKVWFGIYFYGIVFTYGGFR